MRTPPRPRFTRRFPRRLSRAVRLLPALAVAHAALLAGAACHRTAVTPTAAATAGAVVDPLRTLPAPLHDARLPDRIDDSTYWGMIRGLSEPGGYFRSENFVSNEMGLQQVVTRLRTTMPPGGVYLGVGPEQNFTYLAALRPRIAFIVDIRRQNLLQHLWYKAVFELSPTRAEFLSRLFARAIPAGTPADLPADSLVVLLERATPDTAAFRRTFAEVRTLLTRTHGFPLDSSDLSTLRYVDSIFFTAGTMLNYSSGSSGMSFNARRMPTFGQIAGATDENGRNVGFLGSEESYQVVRDLQRRNLVIPLTGDFAGPQALRAVGAWLSQRGARVGAFYVSNVEQYLFQQGDDWNRFYENVGSLPLDTNSRFIRSVTNGMRGGGTTMMTQLTSPVRAIVDAVRAGDLRGYYDLIARSN